MGEREWRDVPGYAGYSVTLNGQIRGPAGTMRPMVAHAGHLYVLTRRPGVPRKLYVHKAVLTAWVGPCPPGQQCRHLDGDPANNHIGNLCWGTPLQNAADKQRHGTQQRGERAGSAVLTEADVEEIRRLHGSVSLRALGERFGVSHTAIRRAALGIKWEHIA